MSTGRGQDFIEQQDASMQEAYDEPMSLGKYVNAALEDPSIASHASKYLLEAIEHAGTRTVVEEGEEEERYRFFDDLKNNGQHAILGNTEVLNEFVDDLRTIAANRGKGEKILWFDGPTATGKSELKRCMINGLREYSKTPDGRRYTVEWNIENNSSNDRMYDGAGQSSRTDDDAWYTSPVQTQPLSVFDADVREDIVAALNENTDGEVPVTAEADIDPFSQVAYDTLRERYRSKGKDELFSQITDDAHLRVKNYVVDVGNGIGVLHSEDTGSPKERLVGSWNRGALQQLPAMDTPGRKNPQGFNYDGLVSQGNSLLSIVEDTSQHADMLKKMLNVPDEGHVKLDKAQGMDIDTVMMIISNPDLEAQLDQHEDRGDSDPFKALKRRLDKREFRYLTNLSLEGPLLRKEVGQETANGQYDDAKPWISEDYETLRSYVEEAVTFDMEDSEQREIAPHGVEAAALYDVITRLDASDLPAGYDLVDKAMYFDQGFIQDGDERIEDIDFAGEDDGTHGIPVTYTRDILADLLLETPERKHPEVIMPKDILSAMAEGLADAPVISKTEAKEFEERVVPVKNHIFRSQEDDVLEAMMAEVDVGDETIEEYVDHVYAWNDDEKVETGLGPQDPDPLKMKVFETEHLGRYDEGDYDGSEPDTSDIEDFRQEVINSVRRWKTENEDHDGPVPYRKIDAFEDVLDVNDWEDVRRVFEDFDPAQWEQPPSNTETEQVKETTLEHMVSGNPAYSEASAELTANHVMNQVSYKWD